MKINKLTISIQAAIIFFIIVMISGCEKMLEIDPNDTIIRENTYQSHLDQYAIKTGLYNTLQELVEERFIFGELMGDLVVAGSGAKYNKDYLEFFEYDVSPDNKFLDWSGFYKLINQCNDALVTLPKIKPDSTNWNKEGDTNKINLLIYEHIVGEVLWLRSWAYFQLVLNWGDVPFYTEPVYLVDQIEDLEPMPEDKILDQIERDLLWASKHIFINWSWAGDFQIDRMWNHETVNVCAAINLLGDVLIYRDKYEEAWSQNALLKVMTSQYSNRDDEDPTNDENWNNSFNISGAQLDGGTKWFDNLFRYANENHNRSWREQGLVLAFDTEDLYSGGGIYNEKHGFTALTSNRKEDGGYYITQPSWSAVLNWKAEGDIWRGENASYYIDERTVRVEKYFTDTISNKDTVIVKDSIIYDTLIWKYIGIDTTGLRREPYKTVGNIHIKRTCDLYLKGAEVANRLGLPNEALKVINQSRGRVGLPPVPITADGTIEEIEDAIMQERALEFAFEGERWHDLVRIAKRRNDPYYLINKVIVNYPEHKRDIITERLLEMSRNNWKLPYGTKARLNNSNLN